MEVNENFSDDFVDFEEVVQIYGWKSTSCKGK